MVLQNVFTQSTAANSRHDVIFASKAHENNKNMFLKVHKYIIIFILSSFVNGV